MSSRRGPPHSGYDSEMRLNKAQIQGEWKIKVVSQSAQQQYFSVNN